MADFEPPSFSLGLDFDLDSEPQTTLRPEPLFNQTRPSSSNPSFRSLEEDDDFEVPVIGRHPQASKPSHTLKRLRRGPGSKSASAALKPELVELRWDDIEDEIEEFSSQEDRNTEGVEWTWLATGSLRTWATNFSTLFSFLSRGIAGFSECLLFCKRHLNYIQLSG